MPQRAEVYVFTLFVLIQHYSTTSIGKFCTDGRCGKYGAGVKVMHDISATI
jgi:hypothetical protein